MPATRKRRTRTKSPTASEIVAPGGGTQNDVDKLAKNLGLPNDAVSAILNCEGSGIATPSTRTSRSSAVAAGDSNPVVSSAWADFMSEEGFGGTASASASAADSNPNKRPKTSKEGTSSSSPIEIDEAVQQKEAAVDPSTEAGPREYDLPIRPYQPTPGILAQTGTLDSAIIGRNKRPLKQTEDLQEPTILTYESIFNKQKIAFIATSSSSAHSIVITTEGVAYAWGRNEAGQCGMGFTSSCVPLPTEINLDGKFVSAAVGKSHSILVGADGDVYAVGGNKCGQCGVNTKTEAILNWRKCIFDKTDVEDSIEIVQVS